MSGIFSGILGMSIAATWMIVIVMLLRPVLVKAPKWVNCVLWGFVGIRLLCPFAPQSRFSLMPATTLHPAGSGVTTQPVTGITLPGGTVPVIAPGSGAALAQTGNMAGTAGSIPGYVFYAGSMVWLAGVIALLGYAVYSYVKVQRQVREAAWLRENLWICDQVKSPFILGLLRPRIYLSSSMEEAQLPYVVAHEQAHLRRGDQWWKPLGFLLLTLHWFNPFVWAAYILFCRDLELACDESAVRELTPEERKTYSYALLSCSMQRRLVTVCPLAFGEVGVKKRVKEILNYKKPTFWILIAAVVVCVVVAVCFLTNPKDQPVREAESNPAEAETEAALQQGIAGQKEAEQQAEQIKESLAAEQAAVAAAQNEAGSAQQDTTTWIYRYGTDSSYTGYFAAKGNVAYAEAEIDGAPVFMVSDGFYRDGDHTYVMSCDVYLVGEDGAPIKIGSLASEGTAYPLSIGADGFYVTSGHSVELYAIDATGGVLGLARSNTEVFDESGNASYYRLDSQGENVESTEQEYLDAWEQYGKEAQPIEFTTPGEGE